MSVRGFLPSVVVLMGSNGQRTKVHKLRDVGGNRAIFQNEICLQKQLTMSDINLRQAMFFRLRAATIANIDDGCIGRRRLMRFSVQQQ